MHHRFWSFSQWYSWPAQLLLLVLRAASLYLVDLMHLARDINMKQSVLSTCASVQERPCLVELSPLLDVNAQYVITTFPIFFQLESHLQLTPQFTQLESCGRRFTSVCILFLWTDMSLIILCNSSCRYLAFDIKYSDLILEMNVWTLIPFMPRPVISKGWRHYQIKCRHRRSSRQRIQLEVRCRGVPSASYVSLTVHSSNSHNWLAGFHPCSGSEYMGRIPPKTPKPIFGWIKFSSEDGQVRCLRFLF